MTKLDFIIVCDKAYIAEQNGKLNIEGVFDTINSPSYPAIHPSMSVVVGIKVDKTTNTEKIVMKKDGNTILSVPDKKVNKVLSGKHRFIHNLLNVAFPEAGKYVIEVYVNNELIGLTEINVLQN